MATTLSDTGHSTIINRKDAPMEHRAPSPRGNRRLDRDTKRRPSGRLQPDLLLVEPDLDELAITNRLPDLEQGDAAVGEVLDERLLDALLHGDRDQLVSLV